MVSSLLIHYPEFYTYKLSYEKVAVKKTQLVQPSISMECCRQACYQVGAWRKKEKGRKKDRGEKGKAKREMGILGWKHLLHFFIFMETLIHVILLMVHPSFQHHIPNVPVIQNPSPLSSDSRAESGITLALKMAQNKHKEYLYKQQHTWLFCKLPSNRNRRRTKGRREWDRGEGGSKGQGHRRE